MSLLILDAESTALDGRLRTESTSSGHAALFSKPAGDEATGTPLFLVGEREHRLYPLEPATIEYIESDGNYVKYFRNKIEYIARDSIKRLDELLSPAGFLRIERSFLLNMRAIAYVQPAGRGSFAFTLLSGAQLNSGNAYRDSILTALPLRRRGPRSEVRRTSTRRPLVAVK